MANPFAPLTPEQLTAHQERRAAGEAEIARKEAALAEAEADLARARATAEALEAEFEISRHPKESRPSSL